MIKLIVNENQVHGVQDRLLIGRVQIHYKLDMMDGDIIMMNIFIEDHQDWQFINR